MAQLPYFVLSPNTLLSVIGLMRGPDTTRPTPAENWRDATVDVIIPALNEEEHIVLCLASVLRQTLRPRQIVLVDDGSSDATAARARAFCEFHGVELVVIRRHKSIGKTPTIKQQTRALDSDVQFILDADTVLESERYIERTVQDLYQAVGIASACGTVLPLRQKDRRAASEASAVRAFVEAFPPPRPATQKGWLRRLASGMTNAYREVLYLFLQRFIYRGQMALFGTTCNPVGCAVAYRRTYLKALFDRMEPLVGDDLTNSEDIFIGLAMLNEGYRNIQLTDVYARTVEPEVQRLPKQVYLWSSAFLQSAFYFDALLKSPFKVLRRRRLHRRPRNGSDGHGPLGGARSAAQHVSRELKPATAAPSSAAFASLSGISPHAPLSMAMEIPNARPSTWGLIAGAGPSVAPLPISERRQIQEPYRQAFGSEYTKAYGRPIGWALMSGAVEKICFPIVLLMMALFGNWEGVIVTVCAETLLTVTALIVVMKGQRLEYLLKGIAVTPIRYVLLACELGTIGRFASDMWLTKDRKWRK
jgi:glycosyltransferase involved in cell wall biosynthesis